MYWELMHPYGQSLQCDEGHRGTVDTLQYRRCMLKRSVYISIKANALIVQKNPTVYNHIQIIVYIQVRTEHDVSTLWSWNS